MEQRGLKYSIYRMRLPESPHELVDAVSFVPPDICFSHGLAGEAIAGFCTRLIQPGEKITPDIFRPNRAFLNLLHEVIAANAPAVPELQAEARRQHTGCVYIIDGRTLTSQGNVPAHDIIGSFQVRGGEVVAEAYTANPNYVLLSSEGFVRLGIPALQDALLARLLRAVIKPKA